MSTKKFTYKNIELKPLNYYSNDLRAEGIFAYIVKGKVDDERLFFYDSTIRLRSFLNYLTLCCKHGFKEMDNYIYFDKELDDNAIFDKRVLPPTVAIAHPDRNANILEYIQTSLIYSETVDLSNSVYVRIDNALFLYRKSFFQETEGMRYVLRFTALESLIDDSSPGLDKELIKEMTKLVREICKEKKVVSSDIEKICSHIGMLTRNSIKNNIKNTIEKYQIKRYGKKIDIDKLWKARCDFVHSGIEIKNIHRLSIVLEDIIPMLVKKIMKSIPTLQKKHNCKETRGVDA